MGIRDIFEKLKGKDEVYEQLSAQDRAMTKIENRKLSHNENALRKIQHEKREEMIKAQLQKHLKQKDSEYWHDNRIINQPNIFRGQKNMFAHNGGIMK